MHLDARTHRDLLAGTLPAGEARALADHLDAGCDACEAFLAAQDVADAADARADAALAEVTAQPASGTDAEFAAIARRLPAARATRSWGALVRRSGPALLAAAMAVLVAGAGLLAVRGPGRPDWDGTKGAGAVAPAVRLRFLVVDGGEETATVRRGATGDVLAAASRLEFEVELGAPAHVALTRVGPDGAVEAFWSGALPAGESLFTIDGRPAAYGLEELGGRQRFAAIASAAPLPEDALRRAARGAPPDGVAVDAVEVRVE